MHISPASAVLKRKGVHHKKADLWAMLHKAVKETRTPFPGREIREISADGWSLSILCL
jgi:hypothetical protein